MCRAPWEMWRYAYWVFGFGRHGNKNGFPYAHTLEFMLILCPANHPKEFVEPWIMRIMRVPYPSRGQPCLLCPPLCPACSLGGLKPTMPTLPTHWKGSATQYLSPVNTQFDANDVCNLKSISNFFVRLCERLCAMGTQTHPLNYRINDNMQRPWRSGFLHGPKTRPTKSCCCSVLRILPWYNATDWRRKKKNCSCLCQAFRVKIANLLFPLALPQMVAYPSNPLCRLNIKRRTLLHSK